MRISDWSSDVCSSDLPAIGTEPFEGAEPRLVGHARRSFDPITEIDIGKAGAGGALDMIENDIGAQPFAERVLRVEEAVDHRQSVALPVGEAATDKAAAEIGRASCRERGGQYV